MILVICLHQKNAEKQQYHILILKFVKKPLVQYIHTMHNIFVQNIFALHFLSSALVYEIVNAILSIRDLT